MVRHRAVDYFSLDRVSSRRTIPWKLLEKANTGKKPRNSAFNTYKNVSIFGVHVLCEGVNWEERGSEQSRRQTASAAPGSRDRIV